METKDPVCGMKVDTHQTQHRQKYKDITYYFCNPKCLEKFKESPEEYLNHSDSSKNEKTLSHHIPYICPMHLEVELIGPGDCPICGMSLEPKDVNLNHSPDPELQDMIKRFRICAILSFPILMFVMLNHIPNLHLSSIIPRYISIGLEFLLATPVMIWGAAPFFKRAYQSVLSLKPNMFTLIAIGTGVAYIYSLIGTLFPQAFPSNMRMMHGFVDVYYEAAAVIVTLVLLGQVMELKARSKTSTAIRALLNLAPKSAWIIRNNGLEENIPLSLIKVNDTLRVKPGESIPVDGIIKDGSSNVDESMITGESMPIYKSINDLVTGGTLNQTGSFIMTAQRVGNETTLSKIVQMVFDAQRSRAPVQRLVDSIAHYFVPTVIVIAILTSIIWFTIGPEPKMTYAMINAVAVLIIACPCALGLATPMSIMVGTGLGAQQGILIKNAESLELMEKINVLVVDKTGTLTEGKPSLTSIIPLESYSEDKLLYYAGSLEKNSEHPLALAITEAAQSKNISFSQVQEFQAILGKGATGQIQDKTVSIGNSKIISVDKLDHDIKKTIHQLQQNGETVVFISVDGILAGILGISDRIKDSSSLALTALKKVGIHTIMLTGDNDITAQAIAKKLQIDEVKANVLPEQKSDYIQTLIEQGYSVAMAGDGINDAPALARAHVGIAMGTGTDIAMESAEVTLIKGDLMGIVKARQLSEITMKNIRQNLFFAFFYNALGIPVAAGALYPVFGLLLNPIIASIAMSLSSVSVIINALRIQRLKIFPN